MKLRNDNTNMQKRSFIKTVSKNGKQQTGFDRISLYEVLDDAKLPRPPFPGLSDNLFPEKQFNHYRPNGLENSKNNNSI